MEEFIKWFLENWNANIFTLFTVLLSGIISLIISAAYYRKGNRNNLKMSVIHPIISILNDSYSRNNYKKIEEIAREYSVRYFKKKELKKLNSLLEAYKEISVYNDIQINANSLFSYFEYKLEKEGINTKPFPIEYEGEVVATQYPPDLFYLSEDLEDVLKQYDPDYEPDECEARLISTYESYCKKYYTSKKITYFDDYTLKQVFENTSTKPNDNYQYWKPLTVVNPAIISMTSAFAIGMVTGSANGNSLAIRCRTIGVRLRPKSFIFMPNARGRLLINNVQKK